MTASDEGPGVHPPAQQTRRRGAALDAAILDAAWSVLVESGYQGLTYEAVAARAMTSRPVLSRRWERREDLLRAAFVHAWKASPIEAADTGSLRTDAVLTLQSISAQRADLIAMGGGQLMLYAQADSSSFMELRGLLYAEGEKSPFEIIVDRALARGELASLPASSRIVNLPFDLARHEILMTRSPLPSEVVSEIIDGIWLPLLDLAVA